MSSSSKVKEITSDRAQDEPGCPVLPSVTMVWTGDVKLHRLFNSVPQKEV